MARGRPRRSSCSLAPRRWSSRLIDPRGLVYMSSTVPCTSTWLQHRSVSVALWEAEGGRERERRKLAQSTAFNSPLSPTRAIGAGVSGSTGVGARSGRAPPARPRSSGSLAPLGCRSETQPFVHPPYAAEFNRPWIFSRSFWTPCSFSSELSLLRRQLGTGSIDASDGESRRILKEGFRDLHRH